MAPKVPTKESGTTTLGIRVARRLRRNAKTTSTTRNTLMSKVRSTSRTDARMVPARSTATWMSMAGETDWARLGSMRLMRSMTSMMLAPGWRRMSSDTERLSLVQAATRLFSTSSITCATSPRRTAALPL